jgi:hypothetical protein
MIQGRKIAGAIDHDLVRGVVIPAIRAITERTEDTEITEELPPGQMACEWLRSVVSGERCSAEFPADDIGNRFA